MIIGAAALVLAGIVGGIVYGVQELLESADRSENLVRGRWYVARVAGPRPADPVLGTSELAGRTLGAAPAFEQPSVDLPDEP